ncbi:cytochrome c biogenesis FC, partial [Striga asiatica]
FPVSPSSGGACVGDAPPEIGLEVKQKLRPNSGKTWNERSPQLHRPSPLTRQARARNKRTSPNEPERNEQNRKDSTKGRGPARTKQQEQEGNKNSSEKLPSLAKHKTARYLRAGVPEERMGRAGDLFIMKEGRTDLINAELSLAAVRFHLLDSWYSFLASGKALGSTIHNHAAQHDGTQAFRKSRPKPSLCAIARLVCYLRSEAASSFSFLGQQLRVVLGNAILAPFIRSNSSSSVCLVHSFQKTNKIILYDR